MNTRSKPAKVVTMSMTQTNKAGQVSELITKTELAKRLKVSTRTIDLWVNENRIPKIKINSSARFDWNDVLDALKEQNGKEAV